MGLTDTVIAIFADHPAAETAVMRLTTAGFETKNISIAGKYSRTGEPFVGFYDIGNRIKFPGMYGTLWSGFWDLFSGRLFLTVPGVGPVIVFGHLAARAISTAGRDIPPAAETDALGAALLAVGTPGDSVVQYETALQADDVLVMAHGPAEDVTCAKVILAPLHPKSLEIHPGAKATAWTQAGRKTNGQTPRRPVRRLIAGPLDAGYKNAPLGGKS